MEKDLEGLNAAELQMWRRQHRKEILDYLEQNGKEATMKRYRFSHQDVFERFIEHPPPPRPSCEKFTKLDKVEMLAQMALASGRESKSEIRELKEAYEKFTDSVGDQLAQKFFLPLLRMALKVDPSLELKPDRSLEIDSLFEPQEKIPDVIAEAEFLLNAPASTESESLPEQLDAAEVRLIDAFIEACDAKDWYSALAIEQHIVEREFIFEEGYSKEYVSNAKRWLAKAENPLELAVCY